MYVECLVKQKQSGASKFFKMFLIFIAVVAGMLSLIGVIVALIVAVIAGLGAYFLNLYTDLEYEYLYLDRELIIDKVMAKSKRKRVATYTVDRMEILAPLRSYQLDSYRNRNVKIKDYSIKEELKPDLRYALYYQGGEKILLSPSPELVKAIRNIAPRKVFME